MFGFFKKKQDTPSDKKPGKGPPLIAALLLEGNDFPAAAFFG